MAYIRGGDLATFVTAPVIYSLLIPFAALDLWVSLYQWICFPVYGMARVRRRRYFVFDRQTLSYLNGLEKINCLFCGYANGVIAYAREVGARTEQYWCPIKHARRLRDPHGRYAKFVAFGDAEGYRRDLRALRGQLAARAWQQRGGPSRARHARP